MAGVDSELRQPAAGGGDVGVALAVEPLPGLEPRREQAVLLECACERLVDARALAELAEVELLLRSPRPAGRLRFRPAPAPDASSCLITRRGRNSSRCRRRMVSRRSTSSSLKSR